MIHTLTDIDTWLFLKLNAGAANPVLDWLMPIATELRYYLPVIVVGLLALAIFGGGKGRSAVLIAILLIITTDQLASHLIKPLVGRVRPCHVVAGARVLYRCGKTLAFPSGHATSTMAAAIFFGLLYRRWLWPLVALSVLISYSRVYLGIHYPLDMLGGWVLGGGLALGAAWLYRAHLARQLNRWRLFRTDPVAGGASP
ncbi:MAG: phosphatase PAP2 family protein [Candidatus Zixiibacteriota bacterium]